MRLLLDTHVALWAVDRPERLPAAIRGRLVDTASEIFVSVVSLWEIALKHALARGRAGDIGFTAADAHGRFIEAGCRMLELAPAHVEQVELLPSRHRDPFDRMLVAQALSEPMRLITHDPAVAAYSESFIRF